MKNQKNAKSTDINLRNLSSAVGDFIRYWGFRRIHGQIWTQLYLSQKPLSGADLMRRLKVSKALISPALGELISYELIVFEEVDGKTKHYKAQPDVFKVIKKILREREANLIKQADDCQKRLDKSFNAEEISRERLDKLAEMIGSAQLMLELIISEDQLSLSSIFNETK